MENKLEDKRSLKAKRRLSEKGGERMSVAVVTETRRGLQSIFLKYKFTELGTNWHGRRRRSK